MGENDSDIREEICSYLEFLGIRLDELKNREQAEAVRISEGTSKVNVLVIRTNEELEIAREFSGLEEVDNVPCPSWSLGLSNED